MSTADFAAAGLALYAAHHVGDYWVQTDHQALHKGDPGRAGVIECLAHVVTYVATQAALLGLTSIVGLKLSAAGFAGALVVSGVTHYLADRCEHGPMFWLARKVNQAPFLAFGRPRTWVIVEASEAGPHKPIVGHPIDQPTLGTGAWALDQAWHIFWGVFVAAILAVAL